MSANQDYRDLFRTFNEEQVEYLVVGAHAVVFYTEPRFTKDLDIWVNNSPENAARVYRALTAFGAPLEDISVADFTNKDIVYQIGVVPNRIDIVVGLTGLEFETAYPDSVESTYDGEPIRILSRADLIANKTALGRPSDLLDVARLKEVQ